jgi:hypothetical protein
MHYMLLHYMLLQALQRVQPLLHVFGHIHESYFTAQLATGTLAVNASTCDISYKACQPPAVVQMQLPGSAAAGAAARGREVGKQKPTVVSVRRCWQQQQQQQQ